MNKPPVGASVLLGSLWKSLITHFQPMSYFYTIYRNGTLTLNVDQTLNYSSFFLVIKQFSISSGIFHFKFQITYSMKLNADMKIYKYFYLHTKILCWTFRIITKSTFWAIRARGKWKVCLQTHRNNRNVKK